MLSERSSPAVVSTAAASKLPRYALLALLVVFILPQLFSAQLWSGLDLASFGIARTMATGGLRDWLLPNIDGQAVYEVGPLTAWVSALSMLTIGKIFNPVTAYHLTAGIWYTIITACIWYATYFLSRRDEAQPVSFAFGGEAARKDYGRLVADIAVLITIGTYGLLIPLHQVTASTTLLAAASVCFFGIVLGLQDYKRGSLVAGLGIGLGVMTASPGAGLWLAISTWFAIVFTPDYTSRNLRMLITMVTALITSLIWPLITLCLVPDASTWFGQWITASTDDLSPLPVSEYLWLLKNLAWMTFPAWPFAIWGVIAWRGSLRSAPVSVPLSFLTIALISIVFTGLEARSTVLCLVPSLSVLSALGLVSVRKSKENLLDMFSGLVFTLGLIVVWIYYIAWTTNIFPKMAYSLRRLAPAVTPGTSMLLLAIAVLTTVIWLYTVYWRLGKHPVFAWRGAWLSACGLTATCIVVFTLYQPIINGAKSMDTAAAAIKTALVQAGGENSCVEAIDVSLSDRAAFSYLGGLKFAQSGQVCRYALKSVDKIGSPIGAIIDDWEVLNKVPGRPRTATNYLLLKKVR